MLQDSPVNPYQSPIETVSPQKQNKRLILFCRSAAASLCFLLGAASLGFTLVWIIGAYDVAIRQTGDVSHWSILVISGFSGAIGSALLTAGFSAINREDEKAFRAVSTAIIIFGLGLAFTALQ